MEPAHILATTEHGDQDGQSVRGRQTNGSDTRERVESSGGAKVDQAQEGIDDSRKNDGPDGYIELLVHAAPESESRNSAITSESIGASTRSGRANRSQQTS